MIISWVVEHLHICVLCRFVFKSKTAFRNPRNPPVHVSVNIIHNNFRTVPNGTELECEHPPTQNSRFRVIDFFPDWELLKFLLRVPKLSTEHNEWSISSAHKACALLTCSEIDVHLLHK